MPKSSKIASFFKETEEDRLTSFLKRNEFYVSAAILIVSLFYYLSYASYGFIEPEWGMIVAAAEKILQGEVFYKDFGIVYTPGIYLWTALFFKLFGSSLHSATVSWSIIRAFNCLLIYLLGTKLFPRRAAIFLPLFLWLAPGLIQKSIYIFFGLLTILIAIKLLSTNRRGAFLGSGVIAGIIFIFRIDLFVSFVIAVLFAEFLKLIESFNKRLIISQIALSLKNLSFFAAGTVISLLPLALYLVSNSAWHDFLGSFALSSGQIAFTWLIKRPLITQISSWTKWDFIHYAVLVIPIVIYSLLSVVLASDIIARKFTEKDKKISIILLYGCMILSQVLYGVGLGRFFLISPFILMLSLYLVSRYYIDIRSRYGKMLRALYAGPLLIVNLLFFSLIIGSCFTNTVLSNGSFFIRYTSTTPLSAPKVNVYVSDEIAQQVNRLLNIIETSTEEGDYIYISPQQLGNMYYYITGRRNPTRYDFTVANSEENQLGIVKDLKDKNVRLVIIRTFKYKFQRLNAPIVDKYINENYRITERVGNKLILTKKLKKEKPAQRS